MNFVDGQRCNYTKQLYFNDAYATAYYTKFSTSISTSDTLLFNVDSVKVDSVYVKCKKNKCFVKRRFTSLVCVNACFTDT